MSASERPTVTVMVLNYQRKALLHRTLESALRQAYPALEILVVDNASTDGSDRMIAETFPEVRLLRLPENIGCAARNHGVASAMGDIVVTIDNDVLLSTSYDVHTVVNRFAKCPSVACINFKILNAEGHLSVRDWCHPRDWQQFADESFLTDYILEGASAFRREAFEQVGGYWEPFFIGHEGHDLALRMLNAGYDLLYSPDICVTHLVAAEARPSSRIYYKFTRNSIWLPLRNHRPFAAACAMAKYLGLMAFSSARSGHWRSYVHGLWDGLIGIPRAVASRCPLSVATYRRLHHIRSFEPSLIEKVKRHWLGRTI